MEGVKRTNTVVVRGQGQGMEVPRRDPYTMDVDRERNCYVCGGFGHMAQHCRNRGGESELGIAKDWNIGKDREEREISNNQTI